MISTEQRIRKAVNGYLSEHQVPRDASILVGYSGGPDSTALLSILHTLLPDARIVPAYFDHGIRSSEELDAEKGIMERYTGSLGLNLITGSIVSGRIEAESHERGLSVEDLAREYRYRFLETTLCDKGFDYIALGHTEDDQIETMVTRFFQGSGFGGLKGIPERRGVIIRPLVRIRKSDILSYIKEKGLEYSEDSTNADTVYLRNRVRRNLLPMADEIFPGFRKALGKSAEKMDLFASFIREEAEKVCIRLSSGSGYAVNADSFLTMHPALRLETLYTLFDLSFAGGRWENTRLPYGVIEPLIQRDSLQEGILATWRTFSLRMREGIIFWNNDIVHVEKKQYVIVVDKDIDFTVGIQAFHVRLCNDDSVKGMYIVRAAAPPLIIRSKRDGDKLRRGEGRIELSKVFSEWQVRPEHRKMIPVLEDRMGIVAVLGEHLGYRNKYRIRGGETFEETRYILNIEVTADK